MRLVLNNFVLDHPKSPRNPLQPLSHLPPPRSPQIMWARFCDTDSAASTASAVRCTTATASVATTIARPTHDPEPSCLTAWFTWPYLHRLDDGNFCTIGQKP